MRSEIIAGMLVLVSALAAARGVRTLGRGARDARPLEVVRGLRGLVIAFATAAFAAGLLPDLVGLIVLGAVFLGEELYETGVLALIIRSGERAPADGASSSSARR